MRTLTFNEQAIITGGNPVQGVLIGVGALAGGVLAGKAMSYLGPLSTAVGTIGTAVTFAVVCTPFAPVVGTIIGGSAGAIVGYVFSAHVANLGAFAGGAILAGATVASIIL